MKTLSNFKMKPLLLLALTLTTSVSMARVSTRTCKKEALDRVFEIYKSDDCGGFGRRSNCSIDSNSKTASGNIRIDASCGFSGEPDYSDYAKVIMLFDDKTCELLKSKTVACYTD